MQVADFLGLLGGLALFLYGMQMMSDGICSEEACVLYSELLTDFERVGDHVLNIGQSYAKIYGKM
ncbi:MAG: hypothetical protein J6A80_08455 [Lachnospiraceae bacterium]|nr:hypothetical protein [Lachnospiraceae bacterium]